MKKVKTSVKGRKCKFPGCKHILSIYNHEMYCYIHLNVIYAGQGQGLLLAKSRH